MTKQEASHLHLTREIAALIDSSLPNEVVLQHVSASLDILMRALAATQYLKTSGAFPTDARVTYGYEVS